MKTQNLLKKTVIVILVCCNLYAARVDVTLREFANIVATQNNINILIHSEIEEDKILFLLADKSKSVMLSAFKKMLFLKGLNLIKNNGFYSIEKIKEIEPAKEYYHSIRLKNLVYEDVKNLLDLNKVESTYIKSTNSVGFYSTKEKFEILKRYITDLDVQSPQLNFKIGIYYTSLDDLKDRGFNLSAFNQSVSTNDEAEPQNLTYFLNLITMPYTATSNVVDTARSGFYATVKYLNQNGYTKIDNSPILTAKSHQTVKFTSVTNIPYLVTETSTSDTTTVSSNSYSYKDVGLQIELSPIVLGDVIHFNLSLIVEDVLSSSSYTPTTDKKELNSTYSLKKGEILLLSGVNKETTLSTDYGVPVLKDVFLLGELFKYKSETKTKDTLTISIEVF